MKNTTVSLNVLPILVGPTGSGKTAVALELARRLGTDILSADSRQVYRHLAVGTAKPHGRWTAVPDHPLKRCYLVDGIPVHLTDILEPHETYNAGLFSRQATQTIQQLLNAGRPYPVIVGGTGLYIKALVDGLAPLPERDTSFRDDILRRAERQGRQALHDELARIDPEAARSIPPNNIQRVVRALEVHHLTGRPISWWQREKTTPAPFPVRFVGLRWDKTSYEKMLAERCAGMMRDGLIDETRDLLHRKVPATAPCFQALGYPAVIEFLDGRIDKGTLEKTLFHQTRLFAKRQMTWFRAEQRIQWLDMIPPFDAPSCADRILSLIKARR
ncbi:MAG TPA: tRNA (adenosine(37)-N6)-dimethylallyltransferase MiaA [Elusimicrobiota bacterium]|nr:tRNA (adenosine(37)-N6)-dimethylallyltransferase MiaA [Elusimicrobiota bacterium]